MSLFGSVSMRPPRKNKFDLSHERKMSLKMGPLYPIMVQPVMPSDSFKVRSEVFMRLAPMLAPVMHRVNVFTHYFFVPNRIVWDEWEDFITGGKDGTLAPVAPYFNINDSTKLNMGIKSLSDYMGLPVLDPAVEVTDEQKVSVLPYRAYHQIYNDYFIDQNVMTPLDFAKTSGDQSSQMAALMALNTRAWEKDYFTSALPWAQRGPEVTVEGQINYKDEAQMISANGEPYVFGVDDTIKGITNIAGGIGTNPAQDPAFGIDNIEDLGITINDLRRSTRLQEWLEKNARGGARYVEQLLSHFGVVSDDARLQRAEYLGGGKSPIAISEVLQTGPTVVDGGEPHANIPPSAQGNMAGHGIAASGINGFNKKFKEHGYVIGLMSVLPKTAYQQGIPRHLQRFDKLEYPWPEFANLGEQEVISKELYYDPAVGTATNENTFGYQSRYAEEKYTPSSVHGDMRENLDYWHMGRKFTSRPGLNSSFIKANPTKRIFNVEDNDEDELYCQLYNSISAVRPLPYHGTPRL